MEDNHDHDHCHEHSHSHDSAQKSDAEKLGILLVHWVEHNKSHQESFEQWAEKAGAMGKEGTSQCIKMAIEYMEKANHMLMEAKKNMQE